MNNVIRGIGMMLTTSVLLLAGCVSPGGYAGAPGDYGQQPEPGYYPQYGSQLQGTVDDIDSAYGRIFVRVDDPRGTRGGRTEVRYDQRTRLFYQGRQSPVEGLERGDVVRIELGQSGRELLADSIEVLSNVRDGGNGYGNGNGNGYGNGYGQDLRGSVAFVDTRARLVRLDGSGYGNAGQVRYDSRTTVEYQGRSYRLEDLERGDLVRIQARPLGNNEWLAERIIVERSIGR